MSAQTLVRIARWPLLGAVVVGLYWALAWFFAGLWDEVHFWLVSVLAVGAMAGFALTWVAGLVEILRHLWSGDPLTPKSDDETRAETAVRQGVWLLVIWAAGAVVFSLLTWFLVDISAARLTTRKGVALGFPETSALFVWHLLDVLPLADIPDTVKWNEPGPERNALAGLLLVSYKIVVLAPVLAAFVGLWPRQRHPDRADTTAGSPA